MAGREKKPALLKKQTLLTLSSKEGEPSAEAPTTKANLTKSDAPKLEPIAPAESTATPKQVRRTNKTKNPIKKNLKINFKTKNKKTKKLKLAKSIFKNNKLNLDSKNITLIKNGIKNKRKRKPKLSPANENINTTGKDSAPPVLEPMIPPQDGNIPNIPVKKEPKKRTKKAAQTAESVESAEKKQKVVADTVAKETVEDVLNDVANELQIDLNSLMKKPEKKKKAPARKRLGVTPKANPKPVKKATPKKLKPETKLKKSIKKEVIDTICKDITLDPAAQNIINNLDLNVTKTAKKTVKKRRHSIEKIPAVAELQNDSTFEQPFVLFTNTRRSASPRSKRNSKIRKSVEANISKRFNPYTTRSDSPARILRNGKHRKLKDIQLLDGLDSEYKKRRRLCSEYSGSEISKCSGYLSESDSSFSDLASVQENGALDGESPKEESLTKSDLLKKEILESIKIIQTPASPEATDLQNLNIKQISTKFAAILKRSLSTETSQISEAILNEDVKPKLVITGIDVNSFTDTNSNDVKVEVKAEAPKSDPECVENSEFKTELKTELDTVKSEKPEQELSEKIASSPSEKVPDKSLILDQMKQVFNDSNEETEKRATRSSRRILKLDEDKTEPITLCKITETVTSNKITETVFSSKIPETVFSSKIPETVFSSKIPETVFCNKIPETVTSNILTEIEEKEENIPEQIVEELEDDKTVVERIIEKLEDDPPDIEEKMDLEENIVEENIVEEKVIEEIVEEPIKVDEIKDELVVETVHVKEAAVNPPVVDKTGEELFQRLRENSSISISFTERSKVEVERSKVEVERSEVEVERSKVEVERSKVEVERSKVEVPEVKINGDSLVEDTNKSETMQCDATDNKTDQKPIIEETPEDQLIKENILSALGLQSLKAAEEAKQRDKQKAQTKPDVYTGTLKTVIKLNRQGDRKKRNPLKMTLQKSKTRNLKDGEVDSSRSDGVNNKSDGESSCYKVMKEGSSNSGWRHGSNSSDTAGANRKTHYSNRSNMDGSSEHGSDADDPSKDGESSGTKALVIPEKASSFSIHPDRLCSDECAYCFGKFGLFDTPLHIAQIKSVERQNKILENEIYLMRDSCLCDACYRHVDRRLNPNYNSKSYNKQRSANSSNVLPPSNLPRPNNCHVQNCGRESTHILRRKWLIKMRKNVARMINIDLDNPGLHSIPICSEHYAAIEHLMVCALCKRRLARNHIHYLGFEYADLNEALQKEGIPVSLTDKPVVCKLCRYFATLLIKPSGDIKSTTSFFKQYKKRLLHFHDIEVMDEAEAEEPISVPMKEKSEKEVLRKSKKSKPKHKQETPRSETEKTDQSRVPSNSENGESRESTPNSDSLVDMDTLVPNMVLECASDEDKSEVPNKNVYKKLPESVREAVEISKIMKITSRNKTNAVDRLGSNPSISVRQLFPGEEDLPLQGNIDFNTVKERTPEGWEKCSCTIQYDVDTKHLWQELQKPYGNQSSFLRHLILLEKYFRNGDLTLSPNASHHAVNYSVSVQNRLRAYDNIPTNSLPMQPLTMLPFNQIKKSQSGIISSKEIVSSKEVPNKEPVQNLPSIVNAANLPKNTPISISQLHPNFLTQLSVRQKAPGVPPGLISLQPGTNRPVAPLLKMSQKFKLPVGKSWRPTLIPVNQTKPPPDGKRITGVVQVISNGKPYHISLQDYNRMCTMKKNNEMKQKVAEAKLKQREPEVTASASSVLKPVIPRKQKSNLVITNKSTTITSTVTKDESLKSLDRPKEPPQTELIKSLSNRSLMILPKIPKSLTVIPQTVARKPLQPSSPTLSITTKPSTSKS